MLVMTPQAIPHITSTKAAEFLRITRREVAALIEEGALDAFTLDGRLRVSWLSVVALATEWHREELRQMGVLQ